jgi:sporulation protein YlmC with PRC-barrel domain
MRLSELLSATVIDSMGRSLGPVRDVRLAEDDLEIVGLVVGGGRFAAVAHAWGYAEGRARGPWLLAAVTRRAIRLARFIPSERVVDWDPPQLRVDVALADLVPLTEALER